MNPDAALALLTTLLRKIAPEIEPSELRPEVALHELGDLDSMDFLNLMRALFDATGLDVPERDYPQLSTVGGFVDYVAVRAGVDPSSTAEIASRQ